MRGQSLPRPSLMRALADFRDPRHEDLRSLQENAPVGICDMPHVAGVSTERGEEMTARPCPARYPRLFE